MRACRHHFGDFICIHHLDVSAWLAFETRIHCLPSLPDHQNKILQFPKLQKRTSAAFKSLTIALVIFLARSSKLPAQPTQNKTSGFLPSAIICAIVGTSMLILLNPI